MTTPTVNIVQTRGDTFEKVVTFSVDTSNFSAVYFTIRESWATTETDDATAVAKTSVALGGIVLSGFTATITFSSAVTAGWLLDQYFYDVSVLTTAGKHLTTVRGKLRMDPDVTRSN